MLQFQLMTEQDRKDAARVERRRAVEEERRKRIFNPRQRLFGNDLTALEQQIEERKKEEAEKRRVEQIFAQQQLKYDQIAVAFSKKEQEERKKLAKEVNDFRVNFQKFEDRREFDLNDPSYIKKLLPARLHDNDPRLGISSAQKFEGEDELGDERKKVQTEQVQSWLLQQMDERESADKERQVAENAYKAAVIARDARAIELDRMEKECRLRLERACSEYNRALAEERAGFDKEKDRKEIEDNMAQMYNTMMSDMMTENPDVSLSNMGPNRRIGYLYKGMSADERIAFRDAQMKQIEEKRKLKAEDERFEREWLDYSNGIQRSIAVMDRELAQKEKLRQKALAEENQQMARDQKSHQDYLKNIVYTNKPTAAFYEQFNKSSR